METHADRHVVLKEHPEKSLFSWSLSELHDNNGYTESELIPWRWSKWFTLTEISLVEAWEIEPARSDDETGPVAGSRPIIGAKLVPVEGEYGHQTRYSFFGTDRRIEDIRLSIQPDDEERCDATGFLKYTAEVDFRNRTEPDFLGFDLRVKRETFDRLARLLMSPSGSTEATLRVGRVDGFYSPWSPSISTDAIKVLPARNDFAIRVPGGCSIEPPRLGAVGQARLEFVSKTAAPLMQEDEEDEAPASSQAPDPQLVEVTNPPDARLMAMLSQIRMAAWVIAGLLVANLFR